MVKVGSTRNGGIRAFWDQKVILEKSMKFVGIDTILWLSTINYKKHANFIDFLRVILWAQIVLIPPFCTLLSLLIAYLVDF